MHIAAISGQTKVFQKMLLEAKDKNPKDEKWNTPLHFAAKAGHYKICKIIVDAGIRDKNPVNNNCHNETPLRLATYNGHASVCQLIFESAGDENPYGKYEYDELERRQGLFHPKYWEKNCPKEYKVRNIWFLSPLVSSKRENLVLLSFVFIFQFLNDKIYNYVFVDIIVNFIIQKLKNIHAFLKKLQN